MVFSLAQNSDAAECFNPYRSEIVQRYFRPNNIQVLALGKNPAEPTIDMTDKELLKKLNEDDSVIQKIHDVIREKGESLDLDPRLIYAIIIGESQGNPFYEKEIGDELNKKKIYGLFSFQKESWGSVTEVCGKDKHPRLCQVEYYLDTYLPGLVTLVKDGCADKKINEDVRVWGNISQGQKLNFILGGTCKADTLERNLLTEKGYQNTRASELVKQVVDLSDINTKKAPKTPLCEDYTRPAKELKPAPITTKKKEVDG